MTGRKGYPPEFRQQAVALVEGGLSVRVAARRMGVTERSVYNWLHQARIDAGELAGTTTWERHELRLARARIRELGQELEHATWRLSMLESSARSMAAPAPEER